MVAADPRANPKPDIIFINPPYERIAPGYDFIKHITNRSPSLGLLHLAAQVRQAGYTPRIIESDIQGLDPQGVAREVIAAKPRYVGITLFTVGVWQAAELAAAIKRELAETVIIVGGPHISSMGEETIERFPQFDVAAVGEGEKTLMALLRALEKGDDVSEVPGIIYRVREHTPAGQQLRVRRNAPQPGDMVLDDLPFPAWDLLPGFPHAYKPAIYDYPRGPVATIAASRGCPFHCKFCDTSTFGAKVRYYSPKAVFEMMKHLNNTYGVRHIAFVDDLFLASQPRAAELCHLILDNKLKMTWSCTARVDTVKPDILSLMKKAGCWEISFGLETGSDELLKKMDKVASVEKSEQAVGWTAAAGIRVKGLFMLGYPGETKETIEETKAFTRRIPMTVMNLTKFTPYPGSPIYRDLYGTNIRDDHWEQMNGMNFIWSPEGISVDELDRQYQSMLSWFYRQPRVHWKYTTATVRNPGHLLRLMRCGIGFTGAKLRSFVGGRKGLLVKPREQKGNALHVMGDAMSGAATAMAFSTGGRPKGGAMALPLISTSGGGSCSSDGCGEP